MKPADVKNNTYIDSTELQSGKEAIDKNTKFKVDDHVRISKYKKKFAKVYTFGLKKFLKLNELKK